MYDSSILFPALHRITIKIYELKTDGPSDDDREYAEYACDILEKILGEQTYVAGNFLSIADFSVIACISSLHYLIPIQMNTYPRITAWMKRMEHLPYYYMNQYGLEKQIKLMEECKNKHRRMNGEISSYSTSTCSEK
ncbi:hypothetical protein HHI36_022239 [Cryptolaemus montrouzieri]|uniref:GST C-terminal domain-containing protein n=1 Tax=Cryptolaemus montrouzieri TaxID=559131 RepID=A0ABD2MZD9_9CUCU